MREIIKELLLKEDERFSWRKLGLFSDIDMEVDWILDNIKPIPNAPFRVLKETVLTEFYRHKGLYSYYPTIRNEKLLLRGVRSLITARLNELFKKGEITDTDKYIAPRGDTISYSLSDERLSYISEGYLNSDDIHSTKVIAKKCYKAIDELYPLAEDFVIERLEDNDNFYWGKVYQRMKSVVEGFSYQISGVSVSNFVYDMWCDTCLTLNQALLSGRLNTPVKAKDIISYAVGIVKNKNKDHLKRVNKTNPLSLDKVEYKVTYNYDDNFFNTEDANPHNFKSQKIEVTNYIDLNDEDEMRNHLVLALYNENHPLHDKLIEGYERGVKLLFEHYLDSLSYEEMVIKRLGELSQEEMVKNAARIRQEVKRVKQKLINRFASLIKSSNYEQTYR